MKKAGILLTFVVMFFVLSLSSPKVSIAAAGAYQNTEISAAWDGTDANPANDLTADYDYAYGDEASVTFNLPWNFSFYGQPYSRITADTNGNIWFAATDSAHSFNLANTGRGPVIAAWNNDLSSNFYGGVFVQHKANPERVVIEWQTETYSEEGGNLLNNFEVVLFPNGTLRFDYRTFNLTTGKDFGSGVSPGSGTSSLNLTTVYGNVFTLAGRSFQLAPSRSITLSTQTENFGDVYYGTTSQPHTISVANSGADNLAINTVALTGGNAMFSIVPGGDGCSGTTLAPLQSCALQVVFSAAGIGSYSAKLAISSSDTLTPVVDVTLNGNGVYPTLNIVKNDIGSGMVTSSPAGISCGSVCSKTYTLGSALTLTASADPGSVFTGWSGACSGSGDCTITMDASKSVAASFTPLAPPTVTIVSPTGTSNNNRPVLQYSVSNGTVVVKVDGAVVNKASGDMLDALSDGSHVIRVEATNKAGFTGFAERTYIVDTIPPVATSITPAAGSTNVALEATVSVRFSEPLDPASVTAAMVSLTSQGASVPGSVTLSGDSTTLIFKPANNLANTSTFAFTLKAGARDAVGNTIPSDLSVTFTTTSKVSLLIENEGDASSPYVLASGSYTSLTIRNSFVALDGAVDAITMDISSNSTLTQKATALSGMEYLDLTITGVLSIDASSKIDVSGKGYLGGGQGGNGDTGRTLGNTTIGGSGYYAGGSYGGRGGTSGWGSFVNATYGSMQQPGEVGSGGGGAPSGNGGGLVKLTAGALILNGSILADGINVDWRGGGSGGGILINAGAISGSGTISARGGSVTDTSTTRYGAGGGGRIAIYYDTNTLPVSNIVASGGQSSTGSNPAYNGGAGTIYLKDNAKTKADVIINNGGIVTSNTTAVPGGDYGLVDVKGGAAIAVTGSFTTDLELALSGSQMTVDGALNLPANLTLTNSTLNVSGGLDIQGNLQMTQSNLTIKDTLKVAGNITLQTNSVLSHYEATTTNQWKLDVTASSITIDTVSKIDVSGKGYLGGGQGGNNGDTGRTLGNTTIGGSGYYAGGSYGGRGGASAWGAYSNATYGSMQQPGEVGSGGGGSPSGNGGGLVKLTTGTLILNGSILADGVTVNWRGGGSGGGILINAGAISGSGTISARGGSVIADTTSYGAGGGGRIAIYYGTNSLPISNVIATGGQSGNGSNSTRNGGAGTVYINQSTIPLSIIKSGMGTGTITSSPFGISCGTACTSQFTAGSTVALTASPDSGSTFAGWSGACTGIGPCTVTMNAAKAVTATFAEVPPPTVTIISPSGFSKDNKPVLQYTVSGGTVVVKVDGVVVNKISGNTLDTLADGTHLIRVEAANSAGKTGFAETSFTIDTTPPALTVSTLADGSYTNNEVLNVAGTVSDNSAVGDLTINGVIVPLNADGSYSHALLLASGGNRLEIVATDLAGNPTSDIRTVNLDQTAPLLVVTLPADNSKTATALLDVTGSVDETSTVTVKLGSDTQSAAMSGSAFTAPLALTPGYNTIEVTATDLANNTSSQKRTVVFDDQIPSLAVTIPSEDIRTNMESLTIRGTVSDPYTAVSVTITVDDRTFTPPVIDGRFEQAVVFTTEKGYAIVVTAVNEVGTSARVQRNIIYDITPPVLSIDPVISPTALASQLIGGTREAGVEVAVTCPTAVVGTVEYPTDTTWRAALSAMRVGDNIVTAQAQDASGNQASASSRVSVLTFDSDVAFSVSPNTIWPPNHKMVPVTIGGKLNIPAADVQSVDISLTDEYGRYSYNNLIFDGTVLVEAWRDGGDTDGRTYTVTAVVTRRDGSITTTTTAVLVPHDMEK